MAVAKRASVVAAVKGVQQGAVLTDQGSLGGGGTGVDAEIAVSLVGGRDLSCARCTGVMALGKRVIVLLVRQRAVPYVPLQTPS